MGLTFCADAKLLVFQKDADNLYVQTEYRQPFLHLQIVGKYRSQVCFLSLQSPLLSRKPGQPPPLIGNAGCRNSDCRENNWLR